MGLSKTRSDGTQEGLMNKPDVPREAGSLCGRRGTLNGQRAEGEPQYAGGGSVRRYLLHLPNSRVLTLGQQQRLDARHQPRYLPLRYQQ